MHPIVNGAWQAGRTLMTAGWPENTKSVMRVGDVVTIKGVYSLNPHTKKPTENLQSFAIDATANSDEGGRSTLQISPAIIPDGPLRTVSGYPANGAEIYGYECSLPIPP